MIRTLAKDLSDRVGSDVEVRGWVDASRNMAGGYRFVVVRDHTGTVQAVVDSKTVPDRIKKNDIITLSGELIADERARQGYEIQATGVQILASPEGPMPVGITERSTDQLGRVLDHRAVSLRNPKIRAIFELQGGIITAFSDYMRSQGFFQIWSPKIGPAGAEGGSDVFTLDYFGKPATLAQSPQLYKQIMVGSAERVFEVGFAYRAEPHDTSRHLNEYLSLDVEMGFIDGVNDLLDIEEGMLRYVVGVVADKYAHVFEMHDVDVPIIGDAIPRMSLAEMKDELQTRYGKSKDDGKDIDPEGERLAHQFVREEFGSDFVFLTGYPMSVRPFYTMPSATEAGGTESFDCLMRGLEITTGGQRIHDYHQMLSAMRGAGVNPDDFTGYLEAFKFGMPPHGGFGIGAERLTARFLDLDTVKEASLFPRTQNRYSP